MACLTLNMTDENPDIDIDNNIARVDSWKPYDFLSFIEGEMSLRGREYQIMDLASDLGSIKLCINYAAKCQKSRYEVVKFILWALDGVTDEKITSLRFLTGCLRGFFGNTISAPEKMKKARGAINSEDLSADMRSWLDSLKESK